MSNSKTNQSGGKQTRNLPSWMSSRENSSESKSNDEEHVDFSKLMEGVVFVLSGFVNPERGTLRSKALAMGAEYQPEWNSNCTLLICAFQNTPKFRQVEADCGTIVSKEWILESHAQKKLVDIDPYLMHAGKPWRKTNIAYESSKEQQKSSSPKSYKQVEKTPSEATSVSSKNKVSHLAKESEVKKWVIDDFNGTISWLESQEEKPQPHEIKQIARDGILTCLQDAVDCLDHKQDVRRVIEQWSFVPRVVRELAIFNDTEHVSLTTEDILSKAKVWKQIYEDELNKLQGDYSLKNKNQKISEGKEGNDGRSKAASRDTAAYDSDETIEMTEQEIDLAYKNFAAETS